MERLKILSADATNARKDFEELFFEILANQANKEVILAAIQSGHFIRDLKPNLIDHLRRCGRLSIFKTIAQDIRREKNS